LNEDNKNLWEGKMGSEVEEKKVVITPTSRYQHLHNDYPYPIEIDGVRYSSITHFVYASMMPDTSSRGYMMLQLDGKTARDKATGILFGRKDADGKKKLPFALEVIMMRALRRGYKALFAQKNIQGKKNLHDKLLGTGEEDIVYLPDGDTFYPGDTTVLGLNAAGNGQNKLGEILKEVRKEYQLEAYARMKAVDHPEIDKLFRIVVRRKILMEELNRGHLPLKYDLESLYTTTKGIPERFFEQEFNNEFPYHRREMYWQQYKEAKERNRKVAQLPRFQREAELTNKKLELLKAQYELVKKKETKEVAKALWKKTGEVVKKFKNKQEEEKKKEKRNITEKKKKLLLRKAELLREYKRLNADLELYQPMASGIGNQITDLFNKKAAPVLKISEQDLSQDIQEELKQVQKEREEKLGTSNAENVAGSVLSDSDFDLDAEVADALKEPVEEKKVVPVQTVFKRPVKRRPLTIPSTIPEAPAVPADNSAFYRTKVAEIRRKIQEIVKEDKQINEKLNTTSQPFQQEESSDDKPLKLFYSEYGLDYADSIAARKNNYTKSTNLKNMIDTLSEQVKRLNGEFERLKQPGLIAFDPEIVREFDSNDQSWIRDEYEKTLRKRAVLICYLAFMKVRYEDLLFSIAREKVVHDYEGKRLVVNRDLRTAKEVERKGDQFEDTVETITLGRYLSENHINPDILTRIGEEALLDLRTRVWHLFEDGKLDHISRIEEKVNEKFQELRKLLLETSFEFPRYVPKLVNPSEKFLRLIDENLLPEPESPRMTYGGRLLEKYYDPSSPEGACSEVVEEKCPLGDDDDEDNYSEHSDQEEDGYDMSDDDTEDSDNEEEYSEEEEEDGERGERVESGQEPEQDNLGFVQAAPTRIKKYVMPVNPIKFTNEKSYPYEWLSPMYPQVIEIKGYHYPSVAHYVIAMLATPFRAAVDSGIINVGETTQYFRKVPYRVLRQVDGAVDRCMVCDKEGCYRLECGKKKNRSHPRQWIQKDSSYFFNPMPNAEDSTYQFEFDPTKPNYVYQENKPVRALNEIKPLPQDLLRNGEGFRPLKELLEELPARVKHVYDTLYLQFASKAIAEKVRHYPYRQILFQSGKLPIEYYDGEGRSALAGSKIAKLFENLRAEIDDVDEAIILKSPDFTKSSMADFITMRTCDLVRSIVVFARYRFAKREGNLNSNFGNSEPFVLPVIGFNDARFVSRYLLGHCRDIDYNLETEPAPDKFETLLINALRASIGKYMPEREFKDMSSDVYTEHNQKIISVKIASATAGTGAEFDKTIFIDYHAIKKFVWTHICYLVNDLTQGMGDNYSNVDLKAKIEDTRRAIRVMKLKPKMSQNALDACANILATLMLHFPHQKRLGPHEIAFLKDFLFPIGKLVDLEFVGGSPMNRKEQSRSNKYTSKYPELVDVVTAIYHGNVQQTEALEQLCWIIEGAVYFSNPTEDKKDEMPAFTSMRIKFFASMIPGG
jgi:predicted NAD-dependent protein-ADP-ribosyltransferase YbiA (DUF1768 family)